MNNSTKRQLRRIVSGIGGMMLILSAVIYSGVESPFFNHWNPLYNPYYFVVMAFVFFIIRTYIKERKVIWNSIGFFQRSGLTEMYDVAAENVGMTHISYTTPDGERHQIKHSHPFAIPSAEGYDNVFLTPKNSVSALNPAKLWKKYSGLTKELKEQLEPLLDQMSIVYQKMMAVWPEAPALDPDMLSVDETENDDPDTLMQEFDHHVSDIRKGFQGKTGLKENWFYILTGIMIGGLAFTLVFMGIGVNFGAILAHA